MAFAPTVPVRRRSSAAVAPNEPSSGVSPSTARSSTPVAPPLPTLSVGGPATLNPLVVAAPALPVELQPRASSVALVVSEEPPPSCRDAGAMGWVMPPPPATEAGKWYQPDWNTWSVLRSLPPVLSPPFKVQAAPVEWLDNDGGSGEEYSIYARTFLGAISALITTLASVYVVVVSQVMDKGLTNTTTASSPPTGMPTPPAHVSTASEAKGLIKALSFVFLMLYPLLMGMCIIVICLETVSRQYFFFAFLLIGILLDLLPGNDNVMSLAYWLRPAYGFFPHLALASTILLGCMTGGWLTSVAVVALQMWSLLQLYGGVITLRSRLLTLTEWSHKIVAEATKGSDDQIASIRAALSHAKCRRVSCTGDLSAIAALTAELDSVYKEREKAAAKGMRASADKLAGLRIVSEVDVRCDVSACNEERRIIYRRFKANKISKEERDAGLEGCAFSFGEPGTLALGFKHHAELPHNPSLVFANILYMGLIFKLWAIYVPKIPEGWQRSSLVHLLWAKRMNALLAVGFLGIVFVELYGFYGASRHTMNAANVAKP